MIAVELATVINQTMVDMLYCGSGPDAQAIF